MHLPFLLPENLRSEIDWGRRGKFVELLSTTEGEKISRMSILMSLVQRWAFTTSTPSICLELSPVVLTRPAIKIQVCPCARQHQGCCPVTPGQAQDSRRPCQAVPS